MANDAANGQCLLRSSNERHQFSCRRASTAAVRCETRRRAKLWRYRRNDCHELTHGFDDEGSQFDARGNLKNWWTKTDREKFEARTQCVEDQYAKYVVVDDIHINSKLTLGEDVADLGGEILAYVAWKDATKDKLLTPIDGLTPDQRFFVGFAQWACTNERPEDLRVRAITDPHSPAKYRINGVVVNMPEFAEAFSCKPAQPMIKPANQICKVW